MEDKNEIESKQQFLLEISFFFKGFAVKELKANKIHNKISFVI